MEITAEEFDKRKAALKELIIMSEDFLGSHIVRVQMATTMEQLNEIHRDFRTYQGYEPAEEQEAATQEEE